MDLITAQPLVKGHLGDRRKWWLWRGGPYVEVHVGGNMTIFLKGV